MCRIWRKSFEWLKKKIHPLLMAKIDPLNQDIYEFFSNKHSIKRKGIQKGSLSIELERKSSKLFLRYHFWSHFLLLDFHQKNKIHLFIRLVLHLKFKTFFLFRFQDMMLWKCNKHAHQFRKAFFGLAFQKNTQIMWKYTRKVFE